MTETGKTWDAEMLETFLVRLSKLSEQYGIRIHGCGHCGSPYLTNNEALPLADNLKWDGHRYRVQLEVALSAPQTT
jgi:hypothetical protein